MTAEWTGRRRKSGPDKRGRRKGRRERGTERGRERRKRKVRAEMTDADA